MLSHRPEGAEAPRAASARDAGAAPKVRRAHTARDAHSHRPDGAKTPSAASARSASAAHARSAGRVGAASARSAGTAPKSRRTRRRRGWNIALALSLVVLVGSVITLGVMAFSYIQGQQVYDRVADRAFISPIGSVESQPLSEVRLDWDALAAMNADTVAWVYIPGTNVNYPVVQGRDNAYYLTHDFEGTEGWLAQRGAVFQEASNAPGFTDAANFFYGHHLNDGTMFSALAGFVDQSAFDAARTVYVFTPQGNLRLRTFSLVHCAFDDPIVQTSFESNAELALYVQDKMDRSVVEASGTPAARDIARVFALATCDNQSSNGRYVLFCSVEEASGDLASRAGAAPGGSTMDKDGASAVADAVGPAAASAAQSDTR